MHSRHNILAPIPALWNNLLRLLLRISREPPILISSKDLLPPPFQYRETTKLSLQFRRHEPFQRRYFALYNFSKLRVCAVEGVKRVQVGFDWVAREEQEVDAGFRKAVVKRDKVLRVRYDDTGRESAGRGYVGA